VQVSSKLGFELFNCKQIPDAECTQKVNCNSSKKNSKGNKPPGFPERRIDIYFYNSSFSIP
jgi:hypothetical protein